MWEEINFALSYNIEISKDNVNFFAVDNGKKIGL